MVCITCGSSQFTVHDGIFYCAECSTQIEEARDEQTEEVSFSRKALVSSPTAEKKSSKGKAVKYSAWITAEAYNFILFQQVNALIRLGASPKLKPTVLHIWSKYLQTCEVAFRNDFQANEGKPRLGPVPARRDIKVLYGDQLFTPRKRKSRKQSKGNAKKETTVVSEESVVSDDPSSHSDASASSSSSSSSSTQCKPKYSSHARKILRKSQLNLHNHKSYDNLVYNMNLKKTLSFCYLGLLYTEDQLALADLIRFAYEERIPFLNAVDELPPSLTPQQNDFALFLTSTVPNALAIHKTSFEIAKFLNLPNYIEQSIYLAVSRFLKDLNLPDDIKPMVKILFDEFKKKLPNSQSAHLEETPTDLLALSFILVVLKMLFILDDKFEVDHSEIMIKLNAIKPDNKYFVWSEWKEQATLKEYLFLVENPGYCTINKFDSLSADRIMTKYPYTLLKSSSMEDLSQLRNKSVSKHEVKSILSNIVNIVSNSESSPTSFPTRSKVNHFVEEWKTLPMFRETKEIDFTLLEKDFSSHSLLYSPLQYDADDELSYLLMTSLYLPETSVNTQLCFLRHVVSQCRYIRASSKYWFFNATAEDIQSKTFGYWTDKVPSSFRWLINFFSKCTYFEIPPLLLEVVRIEKALFLERKIIRGDALSSLSNEIVVD